MKAKDIKVGHIYYVSFDPIRRYEFGKNHLAVVLKKNADNRTFIVMPFTSLQSGEGTNKVNIGIIDTLPSHLADHDTFAVYDQIRTVELSRFQPLSEKGKITDSYVPSDIFLELYILAIKDILRNLSTDDKISAFYDAYRYALQIKLTDIAYEFKNEGISKEQAQQEIIKLLTHDKDKLLSGMPANVLKIINELIDNN